MGLAYLKLRGITRLRVHFNLESLNTNGPDLTLLLIANELNGRQLNLCFVLTACKLGLGLAQKTMLWAYLCGFTYKVGFSLYNWFILYLELTRITYLQLGLIIDFTMG